MNIHLWFFKAPLFFYLGFLYRIYEKLDVTWLLQLVHRLNKGLITVDFFVFLVLYVCTNFRGFTDEPRN